MTFWSIWFSRFHKQNQLQLQIYQWHWQQKMIWTLQGFLFQVRRKIMYSSSRCAKYILIKLKWYISTSTKYTFRTYNVQGDPNQNLLFQFALSLKLSISDPMLVKPKCVWEVEVFLKNCKQTAENVNKFSKIEKKTATFQVHFDFTNIGSEMHISFTYSK